MVECIGGVSSSFLGGGGPPPAPGWGARFGWAPPLQTTERWAVPADILTKADAPDAAEWATLHAHPEHGARLVAPIVPWLGEWALAVEHHHERFDATGSPPRLPPQPLSLRPPIAPAATPSPPPP